MRSLFSLTVGIEDTRELGDGGTTDSCEHGRSVSGGQARSQAGTVRGRAGSISYPFSQTFQADGFGGLATR